MHFNLERFSVDERRLESLMSTGMASMKLVRLLLIALFATVLSVPTSSQATHLTEVEPTAPFSGWWDRFGLAHPSVHHRVECSTQAPGYYSYRPLCDSRYGPGDWSVDYYNLPWTTVRFRARMRYLRPFHARVWAIYPTCSNAEGGWTVVVHLWVQDDDGYYSWEGWVSYGHLDNVQVLPFQVIYPGQVLGQLRKWSYSACYQVTTDAGVHTHHEEWNTHRYACYVPYSSGAYLYEAYHALGIVGSTSYSGPRQPCW